MKGISTSVVIPTYNRINYLVNALDSVLHQTYRNFEVIIVDNFSNDGTKEYIEGLKNSKIQFYQIKNEGVIAKSRNFGVSKSNGKYIAFLDSDDRWNKEKLSHSIKKLDQGYDFLYHNMIITDQNSYTSKSRNLISPIFDDLFCNGNPIITSSVVLRKDILISVKKMSEDKDLTAAEDFDTWLKIAKVTEKFFLLKKPLGYYLSSKDSFWSLDKIDIRQNFLRIDKILKNHLNDYNKDINNIIWADYLKAQYLSKNSEYSDSNHYLLILIKKNISFIMLMKIIFYFFKNVLRIK